MIFQKVPLDVFTVTVSCDCGGAFKPCDIVLTSYPPQYPHKCASCGLTVNLDRTYPSRSYEAKP